MKLKNAILQNEKLYQFYLKLLGASSKPKGIPDNIPINTALKTAEQYKNACRQVKSYGLPLHNDKPKNWDGLAALDVILKNTSTDATVLDAGAEYYSMILPWLYLYGYRHLYGNNLSFQETSTRGTITYEHGDITKMHFGNETFDAITCMSVIEHNVDSKFFFQEMNRVLKSGGVLIISTDYYSTKTEIGNLELLSIPWHIYSKEEMEDLVQLAYKYGFQLAEDMDYECKERCVQAKGSGLDVSYSFIVFYFVKTDLVQ